MVWLFTLSYILLEKLSNVISYLYSRFYCMLILFSAVEPERPPATESPATSPPTTPAPIPGQYTAL